jgi:carbon-monoxide dehydrogenase iron sulfur subunit
MGCGLCVVYCKAEHSKSKDLIKAFNKESPEPISRVRVERMGEVCFSLQCRHCDEPWCAYACLTGAMQKDSITGMVIVDREKCMGCWTCILACPNGALVRDVYSHVVAKCDLCPEREVPACVANCPNEALMVADIAGNEVVQTEAVNAGGN